MHSANADEIYWLALTAAITGLFWIPYVANRLVELGPPPAKWFPPPDPPPRAAWAARAMRAHANAVENLVVFAPLALAVVLAHESTPLTIAACEVYFFARAAHFVICVIGAPILARTGAFLAGAAAQAALALALLGLV